MFYWAISGDARMDYVWLHRPCGSTIIGPVIDSARYERQRIGHLREQRNRIILRACSQRDRQIATLSDVRLAYMHFRISVLKIMYPVLSTRELVHISWLVRISCFVYVWLSLSRPRKGRMRITFASWRWYYRRFFLHNCNYHHAN